MLACVVPIVTVNVVVAVPVAVLVPEYTLVANCFTVPTSGILLSFTTICAE